MYFITKKVSASIRKKGLLNRLFVFITLFLIVLLTLIPFENIFITFKSPEAAYNYKNSGNVEIVVKGENTALVITENSGNSRKFSIIPKSNNGWKLDGLLSTKIISIPSMLNGAFVNIYKYKKTGECYLVVHGINVEEFEISDSENSFFYTTKEYNEVKDRYYYSYYAYIDSLDDNYIVFINGESINLVDFVSVK